jgi:hypothetical protein
VSRSPAGFTVFHAPDPGAVGPQVPTPVRAIPGRDDNLPLGQAKADNYGNATGEARHGTGKPRGRPGHDHERVKHRLLR